MHHKVVTKYNPYICLLSLSIGDPYYFVPIHFSPYSKCSEVLSKRQELLSVVVKATRITLPLGVARAPEYKCSITTDRPVMISRLKSQTKPTNHESDQQIEPAHPL